MGPRSGIASLLLAGLALLGCGSGEDVHAGHAGMSGTSGPMVSEADARLEDGLPVLASLPEFSLTDEWGGAFARGDLAGSLSVVDFIFTSCPDACPMLTAEMRKLQQQLAQDPELRAVRLVSFSVDPETDTPEALRAYAERHGADLASWTFVTGARPALMELIQGGFKLSVMKNADTAGSPFLHSQKFVLVDRQARIRGYYDALEADGRGRLLEDLRRLSDSTAAR